MINVNDLGQIVRPFCPAMHVIPSRSARRRLAPGQHGGNRREEIAPMKAGRDALRPPLDVPASRACGTALNQLEQAVAGADVPAAVGLENNGWPRPADAGIDNAEKDGFRCKPFGISREQVGRCLGVANRRISEEVDRGHARRHLVQHRLHLTGIRPVQPEIRKQHNHVAVSFVVG
jgi:hypothetical protein